MNKKTKSFLGILLVISALGFSGCDIVDAIKEKISGAPVENGVSTEEAGIVVSDALLMSEPMGKDVLVRIGSWTLTKAEFDERIKALKEVVPDYDTEDVNAKALILEELMRQQLLVQEAEQSGLANKEEIRSAVNEFRRTLIVREMAVSITGDIVVTEEEASAFYEENKEQIIEAPQLRVSEVALDSQLKANELLVEILKGGDFGELARQASISTSAQQGGDLGYIQELPFPEMGNALITLNEGDVSSVFKGPEGFYIVKVTEKKGGEQIPYDEIKDEIISRMTLDRQQHAIADYIENLRKKTKIELNEDLLSN
jgi:peptidyl-prolyl cis-trans isomerase C